MIRIFDPLLYIHWMSVSISSYRFCLFFFFKQKTAYEMRISDWSSDVCSSDLSARKRGENTMPRKLAAELLEASENRGGAVKKREEIGRASCRERVCQYV